MTHPGEEQLLLYYYGEARDPAALERHLAACEACRASYRALEQVLAAASAAPVPEPAEDFAARVWQRLRPRLAQRPARAWAAWLHPQRWALAGAMAALLLAAFLAGRFWPRPGTHLAQPAPEAVRERILLVAVGDHLDRSQMVLVELVNAPAGAAFDISAKQGRAADLVAANRLYRETAEQAGENGVADVLEELEQVLLEIARGPSELTPAELARIQKRIEAKGILFKVRVIGSQVREREREAIPPAGRKRI
jgi:hypothetical protein